ncbi:alpha/beta fold hydrolase, partial [Bradyrhizobium sp. NBAIM08]|uniref:alpha/beta fold hydrolase n=1 Tax=Bradyrhizobium sp. NBAIM08 TaxID=2793815 RepID=UPI001CD7B769
ANPDAAIALLLLAVSDVLAAGARLGAMVDVVPAERFGEITFPVLVAHSDADGVFPYAEAVDAYDRLPGEKYLLTMHGAVHATVAENTPTTADAAYQATTIAFWDRTLRGRVGEPFPAPIEGVTSFVDGTLDLPGTL